MLLVILSFLYSNTTILSTDFIPVTMTTLPIVIIIISLFTTEITAANLYCDRQLKQLQIAAYRIKQRCSIDDTTIKTCCDLDAFYLFTKPSGIYQTQCLCGGKWSTTDVFCDTETADGGWTVIQRRVDGSVDFNRPWSDYEKGFGDLNGEFWYGLRNINCLTQTGQWELRVDFEFKNKTRSYLHYNEFKVGSATDEYPLTISGFTGITPTDPFATGGHNGMRFSTYDNDNDQWSGNCAEKANNAKGNGGWWYSACADSAFNINGQYGSLHLAGTWYNPSWIEIKARPLDCIPL